MAAFDVLLIEDDSDLCDLMAQNIAEAGYTIMSAENGLMAQDFLRNDEFRMIISDIKVPNRNGLQLAALARGSRRHARVPIVLVSGHVDASIAIKAKELGIVDLLVKPFDTAELLAKIKSYLQAPSALRVNPLFQKSFEKAAKRFFDDFLGHHTMIEQEDASRDWGTESEISSFIMFNNGEVSGEIVFNSTRKVVHEMACATFNCKDTSADDELIVNMTMQIVEKLGTNYANQLAANGVQLEVSTPKVQLNFTDQEHTERTQTLVCIPFSSGEKACRVDFFIKRNNIVGRSVA